MQIPDIFSAKLVELAVPFFILLIFLEMVMARFRKSAEFELRDSMSSLLMGVGNLGTKLLTGAITVGVAFWLYNNVRIFTIPMTAWWAILALFLLEDFSYYWFHRISHESRWFWASHVIHHSSQHYNLTTALRQTWTGFVSGGWLLWLPLVVLGFHPIALAFFKGVSLLYQFWIHTEAIDRLGPLEWVFNTPSHHRVHHATNPRYLDKNYAGILIIWDRMFGSFQEEDPEEPPEYGIITPLATYNPIKIATHEWVAMFRDVFSKNSLKAKFMYLFARPGWSHDGSRKTVPELLEDWQERQKQKDKG